MTNRSLVVRERSAVVEHQQWTCELRQSSHRRSGEVLVHRWSSTAVRVHGPQGRRSTAASDEVLSTQTQPSAAKRIHVSGAGDHNTHDVWLSKRLRQQLRQRRDRRWCRGGGSAGTTGRTLESTNGSLGSPAFVVEPRVRRTATASYSPLRYQPVEDGDYLRVVQTCKAVDIVIVPRIRLTQ